MDNPLKKPSMNSNTIINMNKPFKMQPSNLATFMVFYSPIVLALLITFLSFPLQNLNGFIYLGFLIASCIIRNFVYRFGIGPETYMKNPKNVCDSVEYSEFGNTTFSSFVFAFTIFYIVTPMFMFENVGVNFFLLVFLLVYFALDVGMRSYKGCYQRLIAANTEIFFNVFFGCVFACIFMTLMNIGGADSYLSFNDSCETTEEYTKCQVVNSSGTPITI